MTSIVNTATGEITESPTSLVPIDRDAVSVVSMLEHAKQWLSTAVETTGPAEIAAKKAQIVTAETYARELHLSKEIQLDAAEMVRRAEYALGKAIRKGQAEGTIRKAGDDSRVDLVDRNNYVQKASPYDFASKDEMHGNGSGIADLGGASADEFEVALEEAKVEGNLSRANVVRKVKGQPSSGVVTRDMRAEMIRDLAEQGASSRQMPARVGITEQSIRQIARDFGIEIPADKSIGGTRRHDSHRIARETTASLEGLAMGVELINYDDLDPEETRQWADSLNHSLRALNRFHKQIKETTHD